MTDKELWAMFAAAALGGHNAFGDENMFNQTDHAVRIAADQADDRLDAFRERFPRKPGEPT
jgi:hypothetical protein